MKTDGTQNEYTPPQNGDYYFYTFNVDMTYTWQFALGSFININWKNYEEYQNMHLGYLKNLGNTLASPQSNNVSLKIIYFLDYLNLSKKG